MLPVKLFDVQAGYRKVSIKLNHNKASTVLFLVPFAEGDLKKNFHWSLEKEKRVGCLVWEREPYRYQIYEMVCDEPERGQGGLKYPGGSVTHLH